MPQCVPDTQKVLYSDKSGIQVPGIQISLVFRCPVFRFYMYSYLIFQLLEFEESLESLERQVSELKRGNDELEVENERRGRKEDETAAILTSNKHQQDQQVNSIFRLTFRNLQRL